MKRWPKKIEGLCFEDEMGRRKGIFADSDGFRFFKDPSLDVNNNVFLEIDDGNRTDGEECQSV